MPQYKQINQSGSTSTHGGLFHPDNCGRSRNKEYSLLNPLPQITQNKTNQCVLRGLFPCATRTPVPPLSMFMLVNCSSGPLAAKPLPLQRSN